jgi:hypothetical protein
MLSESREYAIAVAEKGDPYLAESVFRALILQQQKMINLLMERY